MGYAQRFTGLMKVVAQTVANKEVYLIISSIPSVTSKVGMDIYSACIDVFLKSVQTIGCWDDNMFDEWYHKE